MKEELPRNSVVSLRAEARLRSVLTGNEGDRAREYLRNAPPAEAAEADPERLSQAILEFFGLYPQVMGRISLTYGEPDAELIKDIHILRANAVYINEISPVEDERILELMEALNKELQTKFGQKYPLQEEH